jgi:hypothetical protein
MNRTDGKLFPARPAKGIDPISGTSVAHTSFWGVGVTFQEDFCYNSVPCRENEYRTLPEFAKPEFQNPEQDNWVKFKHQLRGALTHSWWTMQTIADPTYGMNGIPFLYWYGFGNMPHSSIHKQFFAGITFLRRGAIYETENGLKSGTGVLNGDLLSGAYELGFGAMSDYHESVLLAANMTRVIVFQLEAALDAGGQVRGSDIIKGRFNGLVRNFRERAGKVAQFKGDPNLPGRVDAAYLNETADLISRVAGRL